MSKGICKGKGALVGNGGPSVKDAICKPVLKPVVPNYKIDKQCFLRNCCKKLRHFDGVLQGALGKEGKDNGIGGKGALDQIHTEGTGRSRRQRFVVKDGMDSSEDNGRSQGIDGIGTKGDGGFHGVGGLSYHMRVFIESVFDKRGMYNN